MPCPACSGALKFTMGPVTQFNFCVSGQQALPKKGTGTVTEKEGGWICGQEEESPQEGRKAMPSTERHQQLTVHKTVFGYSQTAAPVLPQKQNVTFLNRTKQNVQVVPVNISAQTLFDI